MSAATAPATASVTGVRETAAVFGDAVPLVGTIARGPTAGNTGVVLLNAGLVQRAGPGGLHVRLAARLARRGFPTARVDLSGVGDSPVRRDRTPLDEARVLEVRSILDGFEEAGPERFVLCGICTGADNAFRAALEEPRVCGLILLDGYPYRTRGWWLRHQWTRIRRAGPGAIVRRLARRGPAGAIDEPAWDGVSRTIPPRDIAAGQLRALVDRGTHIYAIYTGGFRDWYNHRGQFRAAFPDVDFADRLTVDYLPAADHVFRAASSQKDLAMRLLEWLEARWGTA